MTDLHPKGINMACTLGKHLQVAFIFQGDSSDSSMFDMDGNSRRLNSETGKFNGTLCRVAVRDFRRIIISIHPQGGPLLQ